MIFDSKIFLATMPIITSAMAFLIILFDIVNGNSSNKRLKTSIALYLGCYVITMIGALVYFYAPMVFLYFNAVILLCFMLLPIFLYAFIFQITRTRPNERFSKWHFAIPILLASLQLVLTAIVPVEEQFLTITGNGAYRGGSKLFFYVSNNKMLYRLIFSLVYTALSFLRFPKYSRFIRDFASNESKSSLRWLKIYLVFIVLLIPIPLAGVFMARTNLFGSWLAWLHYLMLLVQHSYLAYHLVKQNYVVVFADGESAYDACDDAETVGIQKERVGAGDENVEGSFQINDEQTGENLSASPKAVLVKEEFERFMHEEKPYLNPELKITDLVAELRVNRTYLSAFINAEYQVNFSCLINFYRIKAYDELRNDATKKHLTNQELIELVGFKSYRSFLRVRTQMAESKNC
jgi:AraC-like DNA-binding protein